MNGYILILLVVCVLGSFIARSLRTKLLSPPRKGTLATRKGDKISALLRSRHKLTADTPVWTLADVKSHNKATDLWLIIDDKVYDVTDYVQDHEGGAAILRRGGLDNTKGFKGSQHPAKVYEMIDEYFIGNLAKDEPENSKIKAN